MTVSFLVTTGPVLVAYPGSLNFSYAAGGSTPYSPLYLSASDSSNIPVTVSTTSSWLSVSGQTQTDTPNTSTISGNNLTSLANGVYTGSVTVTATTAGSAANSPVNVPVVLTVTGSTATGGGGSLTLSSSSMTFNAQQNGTIPASQMLSGERFDCYELYGDRVQHGQLAERLAFGQSDDQRQPYPHGFGEPVGPDGGGFPLRRHDYADGQRRSRRRFR